MTPFSPASGDPRAAPGQPARPAAAAAGRRNTLVTGLVDAFSYLILGHVFRREHDRQRGIPRLRAGRRPGILRSPHPAGRAAGLSFSFGGPAGRPARHPGVTAGAPGPALQFRPTAAQEGTLFLAAWVLHSPVPFSASPVTGAFRYALIVVLGRSRWGESGEERGRPHRDRRARSDHHGELYPHHHRDRRRQRGWPAAADLEGGTAPDGRGHHARRCRHRGAGARAARLRSTYPLLIALALTTVEGGDGPPAGEEGGGGPGVGSRPGLEHSCYRRDRGPPGARPAGWPSPSRSSALSAGAGGVQEVRRPPGEKD